MSKLTWKQIRERAKMMPKKNMAIALGCLATAVGLIVFWIWLLPV